jgi:hypothetical protein
MNSFEQIKALLELKEKGAISEAEFKKMLDILEAESKKDEKSGGREEEDLSQKEAEQKRKAQADQTTREIRELVQLGKIEEALTEFSSFDRKDLFDPQMTQQLNARKAELDLRNKTKNEANRDQEFIEQLYEAYRRKDLRTTQIKFAQIKNKDVISTNIKKDLAEFEKKNADEARVERERVKEIRALEKRKKQLANRSSFALASLILILAFVGQFHLK